MAALFRIKVDTKEADKYLLSVQQRAKAGMPSWKAVGSWLKNMVINAFLNQKNEYRRLQWEPISETMYGKIRYGTNLNKAGKGKKQISAIKTKGKTKKKKKRKLRNVKRFDSSSKALFSSGGFMRSFKPIYETKFTYFFGSTFKPKLARDIQKGNRGKGAKIRHVLPNVRSKAFKAALRKYQLKFLNYITKGK